MEESEEARIERALRCAYAYFPRMERSIQAVFS